MQFILVAVLVAFIVSSQARPTEHGQNNLLKELQQLMHKVERMKGGVKNAGTGMGNGPMGNSQNGMGPSTPPPQPTTTPVDPNFVQMVNMTIDSIPQADFPLSDLSIEEIADAFKHVIDSLLSMMAPNCKQLVISELFIGSLKHGLLMEFDPMNPNSLYSVVTAWGPMSCKMDAVNATFGPAIEQIDSLAATLGINLDEERFFHALPEGFVVNGPHGQGPHGQGPPDHNGNGLASMQMPPTFPHKGHCNKKPLITLRHVLIKVFSHADLFNVPNESFCESTVDLQTYIGTLAQNIKMLISTKLQTFGSECLAEDAANLRQFISDHYRSDVVYLITDIAETMNITNFEEFELRFAEHVAGMFFSRVIQEAVEHMEAGEFIEGIRTMYMDLDPALPVNMISQADRLHVITDIMQCIVERVAPNCPGVVIAKLSVAFVSYMGQSLLQDEDLDYVVQDIAMDLGIPYTTKSFQNRHSRARLQKNPRVQLTRHMDFNDTAMQSWDIYEVVFAIQEVLRKRLEPELRPIIDAIAGPNAEWMFAEIEGQLYMHDPSTVPFDVLLGQVLDVLLPFIDLDRGCSTGLDTLRMVQNAFQKVANMTMITPADIKAIYADWGYAPEYQVDNIPTILARLQNRWNALSDYKNNLQMWSDILHADAVIVQTQLVPAISGILEDIIERVTRHSMYMNNMMPVEDFQAVIDGYQPAIEALFQDPVSPVDLMSFFLTTLLNEASFNGLDVYQLEDSIRNVLDVSPSSYMAGR